MLELFRAVFAPPRDLILLVAAGWAGLALTDKRAKQSPIGEKAMDTLVSAMVLAFLAGGRLLYAAAHLSAFSSSPASLLSLNVGLFDPWAGLATAAIAAAVVIQRKQLPPWQTLDLLAPFLAALGVGLALSHLASGDAFGRQTGMPWSISLWGAERHPTQIYELLAGMAALGAVWLYGSRNRLPGRIFLLWVALAAGSRLIIEGFRGDSTLVFGGLRLAQIVAWVVLGAALVGMEVLQQREARAASETLDDGNATDDPTSAPPLNKRRRVVPRKNNAP